MPKSKFAIRSNSIRNFDFPQENAGKKDIANLHSALKKLGLDIAPEEVNRNEMGKTTRAAILKFQKQAGLKADGKLSKMTVEKIKTGLEHVFYEGSKTRTKRIHDMLVRLDQKIDPEDIKSRTFGKSTEKAIRQFQKKVGLSANGRLNEDVINKLKEESLKARFTTKTQVGQLQRTLLRAGRIAKLDLKIDSKELKETELGATTRAVIKAFQKKYGLDETEELNPATYERILSVAASRPIMVRALKVKTTDILSPVSRVLRLNMRNKYVGELQQDLAFLGYKIDEIEFKTKTFGKTTREAVVEYQRKNNLAVSGHVEGATLTALNHDIQQANPQAFELEHSFRVRGSVIDDHWQGKAGVKVQVWEKSLRGEGTLLAERKTLSDGFFDVPYDPPRNPVDHQIKSPFHLIIRVFDKKKYLFSWDEIPGNDNKRLIEFLMQEFVIDWIKTAIIEKIDNGRTIRLTEGNNFLSLKLNNEQTNVILKINDVRTDNLIAEIENGKLNIYESAKKVLFNPTLIAWVNFTDGNEPYRGTSEYEAQLKAVTKVLNNIPIAEIEEKRQRREITHVALNSGLSTEDVMRLALSHRVALKVNDPFIKKNPEVIYAFIRQNLPPNLPGDLLESTEEWKLIEELVELIINGLVFMESDLQAQAFKNAIRENLIPISVGRENEKVITILSSLRKVFALEKPILIGNGSLKSLLDTCQIDPEKKNNIENEIAGTFLKHKGLGSDFWAEVKGRVNDFGGDAIVRDFEIAVQLGHITRNHIPTLEFLKTKLIDPNPDPAKPLIKTAGDLAKLTCLQWKDLIKQNSGIVPEGTDEKVYANILKNQSEKLFPSIAFAAEVKRGSDSHSNNLNKVDKVQDLLDRFADLDLRTTNLDIFVDKKTAIKEDIPEGELEEVLSQAKVMQRVHRIAPTAALGRALLDEKIYHSAGIVSLGKERFVNRMGRRGIDQRTALTVYGNAEFQYAQILTRIADYRFELHRADPRAIVRHTYTSEEQEEYFRGIPNLEILFGSLDYCDCEHCQSVYSPSAYLADILRFLEEHDSEIDGKNVKDLLFERRPDIGNLKLNCENTNTPLPYIDLVCEILENAVHAPDTASFQTSRTKEELRAFPENVRREAYDLLRTANYPMNSSFDLWQEEARSYLQHLGVNRYDLMESFQIKTNGEKSSPSDYSITGEFWGISSYETEIIVNQTLNTLKLNEFWDFDTTSKEIKVSEFIRRAKIDYRQLLELKNIKWFNPESSIDKLDIDRRPADSCDPEKHYLINLTAAKFDRIHRFLRLWRHTCWKMWELDLLIRAGRIGDNNINQNTIVRLKQFRHVQERLGLAFEIVLSFYHQINTEQRVEPDQSQKKIQPLYINLFQNPTISDPLKFWPFQLSGKEKLYLFSWDEIPGNDNKRLIEFLNQKFGIDWVKTAIIEKIDNGKTIRVTEGTNFLSLKLNDEQTNVELEINDGRTDNIIAKIEDGKLNIYEKLSDHKDILLAAFAITEEDLVQLLDKTDGKLNFENLTLIFNLINLAKGLKISIKDLLILQNLTGVSSVFDSPKQTLDFIDLYDGVKSSRFLIQELDYLLNYRPDSPYGLREEVVTQYIKSLREGLRISDQNRDQIISELAARFSLSDDQAKLLREKLLSISDKNRDQIISEIVILFSLTDEQASLLKESEGNISSLKRGQIISQIATSFSLTDEQALLLLEKIALKGIPLMQHLSNDKLMEKDSNDIGINPENENFTEIYSSYHILHKASMLAERQKINNRDDLEWLLTKFGTFKSLDFSTLPVNSDTAELLFPMWMVLNKWLHFKSQYSQPENTSLSMIFDLAANPDKNIDEVLDAISKLTTWKVLDLKSLHTGLHLNYGSDSDYANIDTYFLLTKCFRQIKRIGVEAKLLLQWADRDDASLEQSKAQQIKQSAKSKYDYNEWLSKVTPLNDELREKKRNALINYLVEHSQRSYLFRWDEIPGNDNKRLKEFLMQEFVIDWVKTAIIEKIDNGKTIRLTEGNNFLSLKLNDEQTHVKLEINDLRTDNLIAKIENGKLKIYAQTYWKDSNDLLSYFLIDVEMSACQPTSRIKQAISSVQMFVQRCFLNLEPFVEVSRQEMEDTVSMNSWKQWKWMKNYRIWEANRKVFLYPENWIEEELRDDKSPFFKELENEILQNEITYENVECAFLHYLQKVHEVSRLEIVGIYHELDDDNPNDNLPPNINVLHVIGRTRSQPAIYYYRQFDLSYNTWTAWEKIDLDIMGDQVIPVVYNRKLYLFWLIFTAKPLKIKKMPPAKTSDEPIDTPEPPKMWEIQLAWSCRKDAGWTAKKVSHQKLIHPWERPLYSYNLKTRYKNRENLLWLDIYISTSLEFNNTKFYDHYRSTDNLQYVTGFRYDEKAHPWHSSSFVFDGEVVNVELKGLKGRYRVLDSNGIPSKDLSHIDSYKYIYDNFGEEGRAINKMGDKYGKMYEIAPRLTLPDGMHYYNTHLANNKITLNPNQLNVLEFRATRTLMNGAKSPFELVFAQQNIRFETSTWVQVISDIASVFSLKDEEVRFLKEKLRTISDLNRDKTISEITSEFSLTDEEVRFLREKMKYLSDPKWAQTPFVYQDNQMVFFIKPQWQELILGNNDILQRLKYLFYPLYHPYTALFMRELNRSGLEGLLNRRIQIFPQSYYPVNNFSFIRSYSPISPNTPDITAEQDIVDFNQYGAFSIYNWELFFHAPLMIACKLSQNQRFEEAMRWFHYIFDPTNTEALGVPERYWITKPFFDQNKENYRIQRIKTLLEDISSNLDQVRAWKNNPFKPHLIARYRHVAYQKAVVMKYIDNLIAWGDQLFRRDTMESINEATMLYVLAYELLGPRPVKVPNIGHKDFSYNELADDGLLDPFSNRKVEGYMENLMGTPVHAVRTREGSEPLPRFDFYFCLPNNDKLLEYWGTVEDRLFKVRHCMNIEGVVRQLPLFEPPIDPGLLVKAAAAGIDLSSALNDINAALPHYRFNIMVQKAIELCSEVRGLGAALLSALEKRDAEALNLLRSSQEMKVLDAVRLVKEKQIEEAEETRDGLKEAKMLTEAKRDYYHDIVQINPNEQLHMDSLGTAHVLNEIAQGINAGVTAAHMIPNFDVGTAGWCASPVVKSSFGGNNLGSALQAAAGVLSMIATQYTHDATRASIKGGYDRRWDDWKQQEKLANKELDQIEKQIEAAEIRIAITEKELDNHELQIEQAKSVDEYMRSKYSNQQLYDWMLRQLATVYFQSYQLAYDMAKRAEKSFQFELGKADTSFIKFGYWDSLKKGMLAGEKLVNDIHRMEIAYLDQNKRKLEITKHVSLAQFMPLSLLMLKKTGECTVVLPEWLFDMDYPGHYRRRIKSVSITIPCIVGPYTSVNCMLSLTKNGVRIIDDITEGYGDPLNDSLNANNITRFVRNPIPVQSIATSHAQNDAGVFELNFNDERYLPFEGAGAVSEWKISMSRESNQFDFATISDIILHIRYTSEVGNMKLADAAKKNLDSVLPDKGFKIINLKHEFGTEWHRFLNPGSDSDQEFAFTLKLEHLPFYARIKSVDKNILLSQVDLVVESPHDGVFDVILQFPGANDPLVEKEMETGESFGGITIHHLTEIKDIPYTTNVLGNWIIKLKKSIDTTDTTFRMLKPEDVRNAFLVVKFIP